MPTFDLGFRIRFRSRWPEVCRVAAFPDCGRSTDGSMVNPSRSPRCVISNDSPATWPVFLTALRHAPAQDGPAPGPHSFGRGGPVSVWDDQTRAAIDYWPRGSTGGQPLRFGMLRSPHRGLIPTCGCTLTWCRRTFSCRDDRLCGVIDFGCSAVGDPACDLTFASTVRQVGSVVYVGACCASKNHGGWCCGGRRVVGSGGSLQQLLST